jgi:hypothetical protein
MTQSSEIVKKEIVKKDQAPKFSTPVHGLMAEEGADVKLFGVLQGHPEPKVTWLHKGKPVLVGKDLAIKIETKNKMTILTIEKVTQNFVSKVFHREQFMF